MLQELLALVREADGAPVSAEQAARRLGLAPDVAQHMLQMLVQRGRLTVVPSTGAACDACPLHRFCAGASAPCRDGAGGTDTFCATPNFDQEGSHGYRIRVSANESHRSTRVYGQSATCNI